MIERSQNKLGNEEKVEDAASGVLNAAMIADIVSRAVAATIASIPQPQQIAPPAPIPPSDKIPWSLKNTLCPEKLDCQPFTLKKYQAWEISFRSFVREAKIDTQGWDKKFTAFQAVQTQTSKLSKIPREKKHQGSMCVSMLEPKTICKSKQRKEARIPKRLCCSLKLWVGEVVN